MSAPSAVTMPTKASKALKVLHTSDWHLGRRLYGRPRYDEFAAFLNWLQETISAQHVDVLIVAGDIFDTMTPSNKAQALYYEFLGRVAKSCCQHVIIVAGNHDSPSFLDAPSHVLKFLNVHVIGTACEDLHDEVLVLDDINGTAHCIIAAVPYLRDRDVRSSQAGESAQTKDANVIAGIRGHYDKVADIAKTKQAELIKTQQRHIPIIATGHLFAAGGQTTDDDGVRELYVGSLGKVSAEMFDAGFDYVALGHLHVPQRVGGREHIRYSGSPIAMGFGEARQQKQVLLVQFAAADAPINDMPHQDNLGHNLNHNLSQMRIIPLPIPTFQPLAQISGDLTTIAQTIDALSQHEAVWLEIVYTGDEIVSGLKEKVHEMVKDSVFEVLITKAANSYNKVLNQQQASEALEDLNEMDVFERCLTAHNVAAAQKQALRDAYEQIVYDLHHQDTQAE